MLTVPPWRWVKRSGSGVGCWSNTTLSCKAAMIGSVIFFSLMWSQSKRRSATAAATKYTTLWAAPIRSRGCAWLPQSFICAAEMVIDSTSRGSTAPAIAAVAAASAIAWNGWPPGISLIAMSVTMSQESPSPALTSSIAWPP